MQHQNNTLIYIIIITATHQYQITVEILNSQAFKVLINKTNFIISVYFFFADDMTVEDLISKSDKSVYEEVHRLMDWCKVNNLALIVDKTKDMVVDFMRSHTNQPHPLWRS